MNSIAFIFPGQGSQSVGMLAELADNHPIIKNTFSEASTILGFDLWSLSQQGPEARLSQTEITQVLMLTADVALFRLLKERASIPTDTVMAGHSLGEYAALVCSESLKFSDAIQLVNKRALLMQTTVPYGTGAMAAIVGLDDHTVVTLCEEASSLETQVTPANFNAIGQVVVAGHIQAIERIIDLAEKQGARLAKIIPVSVPCHCSLLTSAAEQFFPVLAAIPFKTPRYTVISNVDLSIYSDAQGIKELLAKQLYSPVRWVETVQKMRFLGVTSAIECGPGKVLGGLIKRIDKTITSYATQDAHSFEQSCYKISTSAIS